MLKHIVMWKLREHAEGADKRQNASRMKRMLESLRETVAEIRRIEVGIDTLGSPDSWDVVLISEFDDAEALQRYQDHPEHRRVAEFVGKVRLERKVVDFIE